MHGNMATSNMISILCTLTTMTLGYSITFDQDWQRDFQTTAETYFGDGGLTPGMHYLEAVLHVVENSFKTVVVVSRDAILDNWFLMKFRITLDHVNDRRMDNMLVIFLDDVPDDELPFLVKLYLTEGRPFISWEERVIDHNDEQEYFWDDLLKQITVNLCSIV